MSTNPFLERIRPYAAVNDALAQAQWAEKKWVWVNDKDEGFVAGYVVGESGDSVTVKLVNESQRQVNINDTEKMNPPKFDKAEDMADLTHLNEASVIHNLRLRYASNLIYTYSGLFLVAVNPYKKLSLYSDEIIKAYKGQKRSDLPPHIFAVSDAAYHDMLHGRENQSILITGESGAGKTENTKKVIQYFTSITSTSSSNKNTGTLEQQILIANPILESFGNAQTLRNNNSSRFGKFIRIEFNPSGQITGANIERYLLEKSRVTHQTSKERNYHIFYQLLKGASRDIKEKLLLDGTLNDYRFVKSSNKNIEGVDDAADFKVLQDSLTIMQFSETEQMSLFRVIATVLHLGNLAFESERDDQAKVLPSSQASVEKLCHVLGIPVAEFTRSLLKPKIKAGRDWVTQARNVEQVVYSVEALARAIYERMFGELVERINHSIYTPSSKSTFIGVLDIAGFEIFELNSFEQFCINYTNEKLQQFFNHHMFILEQEEYKKEGIEWKFIDFGLDLQPTIDLIEKTSPIGVMSCLDEECVMPKATDKTFIEKLNGLWKGKSSKYEVPRFNTGFILQHYAGKVEYKTDGWLDKNKDPLNENITRLLAASSDPYIADLFSDYLGEQDDSLSRIKGVTKKGAFRTVAQRHKEQLQSLMTQLYSTQPHFVRCIIPNNDKKPGKFDVKLILEQLRCNGVLEGIRICRAGFPNRLLFADFRQRYEILATGVIPKGFMDSRKSSQILLEALALDSNQYRLGSTKVFFRSGVLAELENRRDIKLSKMVIRIQSIIRGYLARKLYKKRIDRYRAIKVIQKNARIYVGLREWAWWKLYTKVKPLLNVTRTDEELRKREALAKEWEEKYKKELEDRNKIEGVLAGLEAEKKKIEDLLIREKSAAADQAEILSRTQMREVSLNEKLKEVEAYLETKENQFENLSNNKKKLESELKDQKANLEQSQILVDQLTRDKAAVESRIKDLEAELANEASRIEKLEADKRALDATLQQVQSQLKDSGDREAELLKQKAKLQSTVVDLEQKAEQELEERKKLEQKVAQLQAELTKTLEQLAELERVNRDLESTIKKRDSDIASLNEQLSQQGQSKDALDTQRRDLQLKLNGALADLENSSVEKDKLLKQKKRVEEELQSLQSLMEEKGNEESKQSELRRLRESEIGEVRLQLSAVQEELSVSRKSNQQIIENLKLDLETAHQEFATLKTAKGSLETRVAEVREELERVEEEKSNIEKNKRQLESELQSWQFKLGDADGALAELKTQKDLLEKQVVSLNARLEEVNGVNSRLEREKQAASRQVESLQSELEEEARNRSVLETQKKKLSLEVSDFKSQLDETTDAKNDLEKKLAIKSADLDSLKDKYANEIITRGAELETEKRKLDTELSEVRSRLEESERSTANLEKTKNRLASEIEDLRLEVEREHNAARAAERVVKQFESQLNSVNSVLEGERRQRELVESNARKLQNNLDSLQNELTTKAVQVASITKSKNDLETELKALIDEIGDGGKNLHELDKAKRKLELQVEELQRELSETEEDKQRLVNAKIGLENELADTHRKLGDDLMSKDSILDETRKLLMKEVNSLGDQLEDSNSEKKELIKMKKALEEKLEELQSQAADTTKSQSDLQKMKTKNETLLREITGQLEEERKLRKKLEDSSQRYERRANELESSQEVLEMQIDSLERAKKQAEKKVESLERDVSGHEQSILTLTEAKKMLEKDLAETKEALEESEDTRHALEAEKQARSGALEQLRNQNREDYDDRISKLEESRRALQAAQRLAQQELDDKIQELADSEKQKKTVQAEVDEIKAKLEAEIVAKGIESAARRKLATEVKELTIRLEAEIAKSNDLNEVISINKSRADQASSKIEAAELGRLKAEKAETACKTRIKEVEGQYDQALREKQAAEDKARAFEDQLVDLHEKLEDDAHELAELIVEKRKLHEEMNEILERHKTDIEERDALGESARKKFQKEIKSLLEELEVEKSNNILLRETHKDIEADRDTYAKKLESELRQASQWKKEKEKMETRLDELSRSLAQANAQADEAQLTASSQSASLKDYIAQLEESEAQRLLAEKAKKHLESRLSEISDLYHESTRSKSEVLRSCTNLDQKVNELQDQLDDSVENVRSAEDRVKRAELLLQDTLMDLSRERSTVLEHERAKIVFEKTIKDLQSRIFDLEASSLTKDSSAHRRLESRIDELTNQLEIEQREKGESVKTVRRQERTIRELQFQLSEKDKVRVKYDEDMEKLESKLKKMKGQLDDLETSESSLMLSKRRAEREASDYRDRALRFEKEVEKLKHRMDRTISSNSFGQSPE